MSALGLFGEYFKSMRIRNGLTLRNFCQTNGFDAGNISKLERGMITPPKSRDILEKYATCLKLKKGSADWQTFVDLAATCSGQIPQEVMDDQEMVAKLPLVFRILRGKDVPEEQKLIDLAELIRRT